MCAGVACVLPFNVNRIRRQLSVVMPLELAAVKSLCCYLKSLDTGPKHIQELKVDFLVKKLLKKGLNGKWSGKKLHFPKSSKVIYLLGF